MDLIEQLGGHEKANAEYQKVKHLRDSSEVEVKHRRVVFAVGILRQDLLEYRRQHNIYEVGDKVVILTLALGNKYLWKVESIDGCMIEISQVGQPNEWAHFTEIMHATDAEIAAGHRLEG